MGIDVSKDRVVTINVQHREGVHTEAPAPCFEKVGGHSVACIFGRNHAPRSNADGNPLAYALKRLNGYTIDSAHQQLLTARVRRMIPLCFPGVTFDHVVAVPSSKGVAGAVAALATQLLVPATLIGGLRKITNAEALKSLQNAVGSIERRDRRDYGDLEARLEAICLARGGGRFEMKDVKPRLRRIFSPVVGEQNAPSITGKSLLVVDDLLSSGGSIGAAMAVLIDAGAQSTRVLVLLGSITKL